MRNVRRQWPTGLAIAIVSCLALTPGIAQQPVVGNDSAYLDSVLRANRYPIALRDGRLAGSGADLLVDAARKAQFFMLAESHYVAETPRFAAALFDTLHRVARYNYYAVEYGPVIMQMLSAPKTRGSDARTFDMARRYPLAFQFWDDEEVAAFAAIGRTSTARTDPLWGVDNEWGALHVLERLMAIAPNRSAREAAMTLASKARPAERARPFANVEIEGRFITTRDSMLFDVLRGAYHPARGSEAEQFIDALEVSNRIYVNDIAAESGALTGYQANVEREMLMKTEFLRSYRRAQAAGDRTPRVLLKVGTVHGALGMIPSKVTSLGTFVHEFAIANGMDSFHLAAWLINKPGTYWSLTDSPGLEPLARQGSVDSWTIIDLRPLRPLVHGGRLAASSTELRATIASYDAVLLIGSGNRGSYDRLRRTP